jgi:hypothetical protein
MRSLGRDLLLSRGVKRSGGGWEGVVPNNGTLSEALVRPEGCITRAGLARIKLTARCWAPPCESHLEATIPREVKLTAFLPLVGTTHP